MPRQTSAQNLPSAREFLEFAQKANVNLDTPMATLLESADNILRQRPGYMCFNYRCGLLIIEHPEELDTTRDVVTTG